MYLKDQERFKVVFVFGRESEIDNLGVRERERMRERERERERE